MSLLALVAGALLAVPDAIAPLGAPADLPWDDRSRAFALHAETGVSFRLDGPLIVLLEFRSQTHGKRVVIDVLREGRYRSRNSARLRAARGGRSGWRFAAVLALQVPPGSHRYDLRAAGAELIVIPRVASTFPPRLAARPEEDIAATPGEEATHAAVVADVVDASPARGGSPGRRPRDVAETAADSRHAALEQGMEWEAAAGSEDAALAAPTADGDATVRLALGDDALSIGGKLLLRGHFSVPRDAVADTAVSLPNLAEVFLDARPSDRVRGFLQARVFYDPTIEAGSVDLFGDPEEVTRVVLDQLWVKADVGRRLFVTAGKQPLRWGSGRVWNPTDVVNLVHKDPFALVDERGGVDLLKLHLPLEALGWNFYAISSFAGGADVSRARGALRGEFVLGPSEVALTAAAQKGRRPQFGVDLSLGLWRLDLWGELLVAQGGTRVFHRGRLDLGAVPPVVPEPYQRREQWLPEYTLGAQLSVQYTDDDSLTLAVEYFRNEAGYAGDELYPWLIVNGAFEPLYVGRAYAALLLVAPNPGGWNETTLLVTGLASLSDGSWLVRLEDRVWWLSHLQLTVAVTAHGGGRGVFNFGVEVPPGLLASHPEGVRVRPRVVEVLLGALVNL